MCGVGPHTKYRYIHRMYTAVIVEPRKHAALAHVLKNFLENLSNDWNILLYHGTQNIEYVNAIVAAMGNPSRISLRKLNVANLTIPDYNRLMTSAAFYESLPTETILIFQSDTLIFPKHKDLLYKFLEYDYVGAPWPGKRPAHLGNGGLSLRSKTKMLEIIAKNPYRGQPEDVYFSMPRDVTLYTPSYEEAMQFSVENVFSPVSFGGHQPWNSYQGHPEHEHYPIVMQLKALQRCE